MPPRPTAADSRRVEAFARRVPTQPVPYELLGGSDSGASGSVNTE
ncbi:MAG: hypothetical protein ABEH77_07435 [Halobacteriaceae archaeon]